MKKYLKYGIVPVVIVLGILIGVLIPSFSREEERNIYNRDKIVFNLVNSYQNVSYDKDVQVIQSPCDCIWGDYAGFQLPLDVVLKNDYGLSNGKEEIIHDYVFEFFGNENRRVTIAYSNISEPFRDYFIESDAKVSNIRNNKITLYQYQNMFIAIFYYNQKYYNIESFNLTEEEFITLIKGIINDDISGINLDINTVSDFKSVLLDANVSVISARNSTIELFWPWNFEDLGIFYDNAYLVYLDSELRDLQFIFNGNDKEIIVTYSSHGKPIRDYYFLSDEVVFYAYGCELVIDEYQNQYFVSFQLDDLYYDVKTTNINENELLKILQEIIWNCR